MVPKGWEHPRDERTGHLQPLYNEDYQAASDEWWELASAFREQDWDRYKNAGGYVPDDEPPDLFFARIRDHWNWDGGPPDRDYYRPEWTEPADHYQMYETVSEGTPVSPVFATKGELAQWMVDELGYSEDAAVGFCESGWAPSMIMCQTGVHDGITGLHEPGICGKGEKQ
jgi:hypothetical protein